AIVGHDNLPDTSIIHPAAGAKGPGRNTTRQPAPAPADAQSYLGGIRLPRIKRGKERKPVEFGHKVFLAESAQGLVTDYQVLEGNPADSNQVKPSLDRHQEVFQTSPELYAGDRGFYSADNTEHCEQAGVSQVCIPQCGGHK